MIIITPEYAKEMDHRRLTIPIPDDKMWVAHNICRDMRRGGIPHALVKVSGGTEVWRSNSGFLESNR